MPPIESSVVEPDREAVSGSDPKVYRAAYRAAAKAVKGLATRHHGYTSNGPGGRSIWPALAKHVTPRSGAIWIPMAIALGVFAAIGVGWSNHVASASEVVADNVAFAGIPMEGLTPDAVRTTVAERAIKALNREVTLELGDHEVKLPLGRLGFSYDADSTRDNVLTARHRGQPWDQFALWVVGPLVTEDVAENWTFDPDTARAALAALDEMQAQPALEPYLVSDEEEMTVVPGEDGVVVDPESIVSALARIDMLAPPVRIEGTLTTEPPAVDDARAQALADHINAITQGGVVVTMNDHARLLSAKNLRDLVRVSETDGDVKAAIDVGGMRQLLAEKFPEPVSEMVKPTFDIVDDKPQVVTPGRPFEECCSPESAVTLASAILDGEEGPFELTPVVSNDPEVEAWADGSLIVEKVSEFTTHHPCCEARVTNIHQIADLVRGVYVLPGEKFSINEFVGPRTSAKGFVRAGAIRQGHMVLEVGGGVSQFITTTFNAAYFAGLDFDEYRSHTIYFSRYPYGREATIGIPHPDLILNNTTGYPILIWTAYDGTSITVSIYSTKGIEVEELGQRRSKAGACTHVETDRQRTYSDGRVVVDTIVADYRPAEGLDCAGREIPAPVT